ncbi:MAG: SLC13 family permease, partial [Planctomycetales bacterium]
MEPLIHPFAILAIGICTVVGLIIFLRLNAFLALISAALIVSLLAGGDVATKISRVATAFGNSTAGIGIVIALAAVIGKCLMDSGSADRIVRAFLGVLGEKNASFALMGSGFVLAVPVFFDTVFYLLVPLARSLYTKTNKNYLLYIMAIAAGGAITHTLVPPTPGPLVMADTLSVPIGTMMLVGAMVAFPAAVAGVICANLSNRFMPIEMRSIGNQPEPEPLKDEELPSLFLALAPVLLPVLMISTNTIMTTLADAESRKVVAFQDSSVTNWPDLVATLQQQSQADEPSPGKRLMQAWTLGEDANANGQLDAGEDTNKNAQLDPGLWLEAPVALAAAAEKGADAQFKKDFVEALNGVVQARDGTLFKGDAVEERN